MNSIFQTIFLLVQSCIFSLPSSIRHTSIYNLSSHIDIVFSYNKQFCPLVLFLNSNDASPFCLHSILINEWTKEIILLFFIETALYVRSQFCSLSYLLSFNPSQIWCGNSCSSRTLRDYTSLRVLQCSNPYVLLHWLSSLETGEKHERLVVGREICPACLCAAFRQQLEYE